LEVAMTRMGVKEYVDALRGRYLRGSKKEKGKVLDEFVGVVGCHRKSGREVAGTQEGAQSSGEAGSRQAI
jgi:hypothetical protein